MSKPWTIESLARWTAKQVVDMRGEDVEKRAAAVIATSMEMILREHIEQLEAAIRERRSLKRSPEFVSMSQARCHPASKGYCISCGWPTNREKPCDACAAKGAVSDSPLGSVADPDFGKETDK